MVTWYERQDKQTINGLLAFRLLETNTNLNIGAERIGTAVLQTGSWGARLWLRHLDETETEITAGVPVAIVQRTMPGEGMQSTTYAVAQACAKTDALVVRVYVKIGSGAWVLPNGSNQPIFISQVLSFKTFSGTWTFYYWTKLAWSPVEAKYVYLYGWGGQSYPSRIENVTYTLTADAYDNVYRDDFANMKRSFQAFSAKTMGDVPPCIDGVATSGISREGVYHSLFDELKEAYRKVRK